MADAVLLLGPTASGKTPLGDLLQQCGLAGRSCVHFDFGAQLRAVAAQGAPFAALTAADVALVRRVLQEGRLLEDHEFRVARSILERFLVDGCSDPRTLVVLNGLPRHAGQADALADLLRVAAVLELSCDAETILERVRTNAGGDRAGRDDDDLDAVRRRLDIYHRRTAPLVDHYRRLGVRIVTLDVGPSTQPEDLLRRLDDLRI